MHNKVQVRKLINLTKTLNDKSFSFLYAVNDKDPISAGLLEVRLSQLYSIRMAIDAISTAASIYSRDFERFFKAFDSLYNKFYYGLVLIAEMDCDAQAAYDSFEAEYNRMSSKLMGAL